MNKIITILLLLVSTSLFSQYLEKGTIVTDSARYEVKDKFVQDAKEEVKQRKRINFLEKKVEKLKKLGHKKQEVIKEQQQLLDTIADLQARIEALEAENDILHQEMIESCKNAIDLANARITELNTNLSKLRKKIKIIHLILISESIIIIIIIISI